MKKHNTSRPTADSPQLTINEKLDLILRRLRSIELVMEARTRQTLLKAALANANVENLRSEIAEIKTLIGKEK
jgi:hypothetical protein